MRTHTDTDHMGDMLEVAKHFSIKEIYVSKGSLTQSDFVEKLERMQTGVHAVEVGDSLPIFDEHCKFFILRRRATEVMTTLSSYMDNFLEPAFCLRET